MERTERENLVAEMRAANEMLVLASLRADRAEAEARAADRAKDDFLAVLGHELRNPLAPILTALELMDLDDAGAFKRERVVIRRQVSHLVRLVDDLLDISRVAAGKIELRLERIELAQIVARSVELASPLLETKFHVLDVSVAPAGFPLDADPVRMTQAIGNILVNAAKYTPEHGKIAVDAQRVADRIVITVRDNGIGIAPDTLPHIFERFTQERQALARSRGGLGLGLAIVRAVVELHGGTVSATSEGLGQGTAVMIDLPRAKLAAATKSESAVAAAAGVRSRRILVVDDNEDIANLLCDLLVVLGHDARAAYDGPTALALAGELSPEVAFLDLGLPVMDGFELAQRLRAASGRSELRLVAISGYGQDSDRRHSMEAGFALHLVKPVDLETLRAALRE